MRYPRSGYVRERDLNRAQSELNNYANAFATEYARLENWLYIMR
jgi:hypothetical protein